MRRFDDKPELRAEFLRLQNQFIESANRDVSEILELLDGDETDCPGGESGARLRRLSHGLRGAGGSYGFDEITRAAGVLEEAYIATQPIAELRSAAEGLREAVEAADAELDEETASA